MSAEPLLGPIDLQPYLDGARRIDWVIAGGESGPAARPMEVAWVRELRDQCVTAGVPFHFKQWGTLGPREGFERLVRLGKKNAGRAIDGRTWDELPAPARVSHVSGAAVQEVKHG